MVASLSPPSSAGKPHESPLSGLHESPLQPGSRYVDLGRRLNEAAQRQIQARCPEEVDLQIVVGDGLSVRAMSMQVPQLLIFKVSNEVQLETDLTFARAQ